MEITNIRIEEVEGSMAVVFNLDDCEIDQLEWINLNFNEDAYVTEKTDSHMQCNSETEHDIHEVLNALDELLEDFVPAKKA